MAAPFNVLIRGDGITGCTLALLLANLRLRVGLVSANGLADTAQTGTERSDIRAYSLNAASRQLLQSLRCWPDLQDICPVQAMQVYGDDGGALTFSASDLPPAALNWIVPAQTLLARLREAIRFQPLIERLQPDTAAAAELIVACEGQASASRTEWGAGWVAQPYAQRAIAARVRCARPHGQVARQWFGAGEVLAFLPLPDAGDRNSVAVVWSVFSEQAERLLALDEQGFCQALQTFSRDALGNLTLASERAAWPLQIARAERCTGQQHGQSWALAGDAAHAVHPLAGLGLNLGLADAAALAQVLGAREYWRGVGDVKLLRRYARMRSVDWLGVAGATDGLQRLFAQPGGFWQALRNRGMSGANRSGALKNWLMQQASGQQASGQQAAELKT